MTVLYTLLGLNIISYASALYMPTLTPSPATCQIFPNEEFVIDPYRCQEYCEKYGVPTCPDYAPDGNCYCKKGFIRLEKNGKCVPINNPMCTTKMPPTKKTCSRRRNEVLREYLYDENCPHNCENYKVHCRVEIPNVMIWSPHCVCKEGFYRLPNGTCVAVDDPKCEELWRASEEQCIRRGNEVFNWGSACQKTCEDVIFDKSTACDFIIDCYCPEGMVRFVVDGECIAIEDCLPVKIKFNFYS